MNTIKRFLLYTGIVLLPASLSAQGMYISPGAQLVMNGEAHLVLNNAGFTNNGTFAGGNSTFWFEGNNPAFPGFIGGSTTSSFYNMVIHKPGSNVQLHQGITVSGVLSMYSGNLLLNTNSLYLISPGIIMNESDESYITSNNGGYILVVRTLKAPPVKLNPGNIGIELTSTVNPGSVIIIRRHEPQTLPNGSQSIKRYYTITTTSSQLLNATIRFHYLDAELAGNHEAALKLFKGSDISSGWLLSGQNGLDTVNNILTKRGIDRLTRFTLGDTGNIQPILVTNPVARQAITSTDPPENISDKMLLYPVPVHDQVTLVVTSDRQQPCEYFLFNGSGHLLQRKKVYLLTGTTNITWNMSSYPAGVYYLSSDNPMVKRMKIIKQ
jgi:hypothetical protein